MRSAVKSKPANVPAVCDRAATALPHWRAAESILQEREGMRPLASRVILDLTVVFAATILIDLLVIEPNISLLKFTSEAVRMWVLGLTGFMPTLYLFTMIGPLRHLCPPRRHRPRARPGRAGPPRNRQRRALRQPGCPARRPR